MNIMKQPNNIETQILKVVKDKDDYAYSFEISENSKGEPCITIKSRSDDPNTASKVALEKYKEMKKELSKGAKL